MSADQLVSTGWVLAAIGAVITTLSGIVANFYHQQVKSHQSEIAEHKQEQCHLKARIEELTKEAVACRIDRESLRVELAKLQVRVEFLEGKNQ